MSATAPAADTYPHIEHDAKGASVISGTTMKVVELIMAQRAPGWSPEELSFQFPHLSMSQVHAALTYYWDHRGELDEDIDRARVRGPLDEDGEAEILRRQYGIPSDSSS